MTRMPEALARLQTLLAEPGGGARVVRGRAAQGEGRAAAVLILFSAPHHDAPPTDLELVLIEKSATLRKHAGQCAFPGGGVEAQDASSEETALREAREEVGIDAATVELLGVLPQAQVAATGYDVTPVVGWWREPHPLEIVDRVEVGAIHLLRVGELIDPANRLTWRLPMGYRGPAFVVRDLFIWGFTGHLIDGLLGLACWEQPWDDRRVSLVPERFLHRAGRDTGQ
ncbi:MAG: NUDIX hydrolase [Actinomycetes bacterium]